MKCLQCGKDITDAFFETWGKTEAAKSGRFNCPHCGADHVRRQIAPTPSGKPQFTFRLWGHPTAVRKKKPPPAS